jgi:transposase
MATAYSVDMRLRVIGRVESGASQREAAEHCEMSPSTAVIWVKCFRETGRCAAKPRGGSTSPLEKHADFLLALIEVEPDLTLDEVICAMRENEISGSRPAVWRFGRVATDAEHDWDRLCRSFGRTRNRGVVSRRDYGHTTAD